MQKDGIYVLFLRWLNLIFGEKLLLYILLFNDKIYELGIFERNIETDK